MERKKLTAMMIKCDPSEFMAYCDLAELGTVVVGPDGTKYRFSNDDLDKAVAEFKRKDDKRKPVKKKTPAKHAVTTSKTSAGAKSKQKPRKKGPTAPKTA